MRKLPRGVLMSEAGTHLSCLRGGFGESRMTAAGIYLLDGGDGGLDVHVSLQHEETHHEGRGPGDATLTMHQHATCRRRKQGRLVMSILVARGNRERNGVK